MKLRISVSLSVFLLLAGAVLIRTTRLSAKRPFALRNSTSAFLSEHSLKVAAKASPDESGTLAVNSLGRLPLSFEANRGQTDPQVKFLSRGQGYTLFLTRRAEAVLVLAKPAPKHTTPESKDRVAAVVKAQQKTTPPSVLRMKLVGARRIPQVEGIEELPGKANYFIGNDPKKWRTNVPTYAKVKFPGVYPGVDLVYYGNQRQVEHDFIVAPGVNPGAIKMAVEGAGRVSLDAQGDLILAMKDGEVRFQKPVIYQEVAGARREISGNYRLKNGHQVGFQVAAYDDSRPLIIDPVFSYSTYLGGSRADRGHGIAVDSTGNAYVTGWTTSTDFPTKNPPTGACQGTCGSGDFDAFVTKLNSTGSGLVYSTYLGGSRDDQGNGIAVDSSGNAYVTGFTSSTDFPTVNPITAACQGTCGSGNFVAFVTKLNASGSLLFSTYLGGSGQDEGEGIAADSSGNAYVTGDAIFSSDFPTKNSTAGACQGTCGSGSNFDAFVTKLNTTGSGLVYSTYLGGSSNDGGFGIAVDSAENAYVTGSTGSSDFPTVNPITAACQGTCGSGSSADAFVTKLNTSGSLVFSTYLGGSGSDGARGIAVDSDGNAYVTGITQLSSDFPTKNPPTGACQGTCGSGSNSDAFVAKLNTTDSPRLVYSTYLGGSGDDSGFGIAVDSSGNAYVTGITEFSSDFPTKNPTPGACQGTCGTLAGLGDAFVTVLNPPATAIVYSTYLGGSGPDFGMGIAADSAGNAYVTGDTFSSDFPTKNPTPGACQGTCGHGGGNAFVTKIANITCSPQPGEDDVEGDGHENGDDGHDGNFRFCKSSRDMEFEERDTGEGMKGKINAVTISGNTAMITGSGTLLDGTPVSYTAVVLGNQPVIGANHFAISWITLTGSVFQTSGALIDGDVVVIPAQ